MFTEVINQLNMFNMNNFFCIGSNFETQKLCPFFLIQSMSYTQCTKNDFVQSQPNTKI